MRRRLPQTTDYLRVRNLAIWLLIVLACGMLAGCRARNSASDENGSDAVSVPSTAVLTATSPSTSTSSPPPTPTATPTTTTEPTAASGETVSATPVAKATRKPLLTAAPSATLEVEADVRIEAGQAITTANEGDAASATVEPVQSAVNPPDPTAPAPTMPAPIVLPESGRPLDGTINILVLGSDRRPNTPNWRTDVIMIVALDTKNGRAGVISIPRDVYVNRPGGGYNSNKINTMDYFGEADHPGGGPELLSSIIENKMGIPIHHFVRFNFQSFKEVVDALGGVEVEFACSFYGDLGGRSKHVKLQLQPGVHRLDGDQAIIYVRSRAVGGDLDRAERQQRLVWSIRQQALSENILPKLPALYTALSGNVQTDIGLLDAVRLARFVVNLEPTDVHAFVVEPPYMLSYGRSRLMTYFYPHWDVIAERAQEIFETAEFEATNEIVNSKGRECE